ncbi:uncharacterized protein LOC143247663 [Tachypleus tridentatus]|uniref:uncharacterized protein LOC143247663 n=1 Tax=Tachypleus tridentatus TaxID=6853 RepID=UPI003FD38CDA
MHFYILCSVLQCLFLIGVPSVTISQVDPSDLEEVVFWDADTNNIITPFDDLQTLPSEVVTKLKKKLENPNAMLGDGVARAFLRAMVQLIGGYRDALKLKQGEKISFDPKKFIQSRTSSMQTLLKKILNRQLFQQFIEGRLELLNSGKGFRDEFEFEVNSYEDRSSSCLATQYKEWLHAMKKGGGTFLKNIKSKFKDRSKQDCKDVRLQANDKKKEDSTTVKSQDKTQSRSAPSSPVFCRNRHSSKVKYSTKSRFSCTMSVNPLTAKETCPSNRSQLMKLLDAEQNVKGTKTSVSNNTPSPFPSLQKINMDLMGDLQDLIYTQCAHGSLNSIADSSVTSDSTSVDQFQSFESVETFSLELLSSKDDLLAHDNKPIPPPRFKRKNKSALASLQPVDPD